VESLKAPGRYADGGGLYLLIRGGGAKYWLARLQKGGKRRDIGLGSWPGVSLAEARERLREVARAVEAGRDPVAERKRAAGMPSFAEAAAKRHAELGPTFRNRKHRAQWLASLEAYAFPVLGTLGVDAVEASHVRDALLPIWLEKPETARRVLQRCADVMAWGVAHGYRDAVPMLSAKALRLPRQRAAAVHHAAMPYAEVPAFLSLLREREGMSRLALEFAILTAARSGEVRGATWDEIDLEAALWTVPAARMKAGRAHVVPLSPAALDCLKRAQALRTAPKPGEPDLIFPSPITGGPMSDMALTKLLRDLGAGVTAHGFRSSFRDWASEETAFPGEVAEMALAHSIADKTEAAYRRGDLLAKRRGLMDAWGRYCTGEGAGVVRLVPAA
jgi:integrase